MPQHESRTPELRLRAAVESAPSGLLMVDAKGRIVLVNREIERLFGYPREELLGQPVELLVPEVFREGHREFRAEFFAEPQVRTMGAGRDLYGRRKDGSQVPVEIGLTPVVTDEGLFVLSSVVDISARRRAEARFRAAVESSPAGMVMVDSRGKIVLVNQEVERMFGWNRDELLGRTIEVLVPERFRSGHPDYRDGFFRSPDTRAMGGGRDLFGLRKDGSELPVEIGLNPIETEEGTFVLASVVDISLRKQEELERQELERQLRQAQKMDAVGTLAGGIAHDFNNILGGIMGFGELLKARVEGEQARQDLDELLAFTRRGKELVQRIQAFGKRKEGTRVPLTLDGTLDEVVSLLRSSFPPNLEVECRVKPGLSRVMGDPTSLHQVFMNLAVNGAQAMPGGGRLEIEAEPLFVTDSRARAHPNLREGHHVLVSVRDTGVGIAPEIQGRVLEPFFTTKPPGQGSGLGLAIVHGVVREHGGALEIESAPGEGTTVRVILPSADLNGLEEAVTAAAADLPDGKGRRILYVDDEPGLAEVGKRRLEELGYRVTLASDGEKALELFREAPGDFDLVVSDYLMPGMNGLELARAITGIRRELPVVMLTGYIDDLPEEDILAAGVTELVGKPATTRELAMALARALDAQAGG
jgi:PAS domain S-box-containing protein